MTCLRHDRYRRAWVWSSPTCPFDCWKSSSDPCDPDQDGQRQRPALRHVAVEERQLRRGFGRSPDRQRPPRARGGDHGPVIDARPLGARATRAPLPRASGNQPGQVVGAVRAGRRGDGEIDPGCRHIADLLFFQEGAELGIVAVHLIARRPRERDPRRQGAGRDPLRELRFGREPPVSGQAHRLPRRRLVEVFALHVQLGVDQGVAERAGVGGVDGDDAVGDLAGGAGVLATHAAGHDPFLLLPGLVQHQHCVRAGQVVDHVVADRIADGVLVPGGA